MSGRIVFLSGLVAATVAAGIVGGAWWARPEPRGAGMPLPTDPELERRIEELSARVDRLQSQLDQATSPLILRAQQSPIGAEAPDPKLVAKSESSEPLEQAKEPASESWSSRWGGFERFRDLANATSDEERLAIAAELAADQEPRVALGGIKALLELDPEQALAAMEEFVLGAEVTEGGSWVASRAIGMLAEMEEFRFGAEVRSFYQQGDEAIRQTSAAVLSAHGDPGLARQYVDSQRAALGSADPTVRAEAVESIGRTKSAVAVSSLLPMLADADSEVRLRSVEAIRRTADQSVIEDLKPLLNDPVGAVRDQAAEAIQDLRRPSEERSPFRGRRWLGQPGRR